MSSTCESDNSPCSNSCNNLCNNSSPPDCPPPRPPSCSTTESNSTDTESGSSNDCSADQEESTPHNFFQSMMSQFDNVKNKENGQNDPMGGLFSMLHTMMNDNKKVLEPCFETMQTASQNINLDLKNVEGVAVRQCLSLTSMLAESKDSDDSNDGPKYKNLKQTADTLLQLLDLENYETNKNLPEVLDEVKTYRHYYLQMVIDILQKQIETTKMELDNNESQEFTVREIIDLADRVSVKRNKN